jgi:hypothetical protein
MRTVPPHQDGKLLQLHLKLTWPPDNKFKQANGVSFVITIRLLTIDYDHESTFHIYNITRLQLYFILGTFPQTLGSILQVSDPVSADPLIFRTTLRHLRFDNALDFRLFT